MRDGEWQVFGERSVYDSRWMTVNLVDVNEPGVGRYEHHALRLRPVSVIALVKDEHVLLAWRHRFIPDVWAWELPGGIIDDGETPHQAAAREAEEETGWCPESVEHLITFEPMAGSAVTPHHVFIGRNPTQVSEPNMAECVKAEWMPFAAIPKLLADGQVSDSTAVIGLQQILLTHRS